MTRELLKNAVAGLAMLAVILADRTAACFPEGPTNRLSATSAPFVTPLLQPH
jgi:hypothetical protein